MSSPPRPLASLSELVLREVLAYLLVDTPRAHHRTAVLLTCSTLHDLGLPLLYKVVDITTSPTYSLLSALVRLFGQDGGLLTSSGRHLQLGLNVVELRVGAATRDDPYRAGIQSIPFGRIHLPRCTRLVVYYVRPSPLSLRYIFSRLPVVDFVVRRGAASPYDRSPIAHLDRTALEGFLGVPNQAWTTLERVTFDGFVWYDHVGSLNHTRILFADWPFKTLVIDLSGWDETRWQSARHPGVFGQTIDTRAVFNDIFARPAPKPHLTLEEVERIEVRLPADIEISFRQATDSVRRNKPVDPVRERLLPLIVLVGPDGQESKLIEIDSNNQ